MLKEWLGTYSELETVACDIISVRAWVVFEKKIVWRVDLICWNNFYKN